MLTIGKLIELALGPESSKVDTAIPQGVFNQMTASARSNIAGWYYDVNNRIFGRLLTKDECWTQIAARIGKGELSPTINGERIYGVEDWACFRFHVEQGHIVLEQPTPRDASLYDSQGNLKVGF